MAAITQTIINLDKRSNIISDQKFNIEIKPDSNFSQKKYSGFDKTLIALPNNILYKISNPLNPCDTTFLFFL